MAKIRIFTKRFPIKIYLRESVIQESVFVLIHKQKFLH